MWPSCRNCRSSSGGLLLLKNLLVSACSEIWATFPCPSVGCHLLPKLVGGNSDMVSGLTRKGLDPLTILGAWTIWNHQNRCVFDRLSPCLTSILALADEEKSLGNSWGEGPMFYGCLSSCSLGWFVGFCMMNVFLYAIYWPRKEAFYFRPFTLSS
jgi:hypothetical protein